MPTGSIVDPAASEMSSSAATTGTGFRLTDLPIPSEAPRLSNMEANFRKAAESANSETGGIKEFLTSCRMEKYYDTLMDNGIDDMEIVMELNEAHLTNMSIPLGHRIKFMKRIKELN
jgi:hypothetical protein